MNAALEQKRVDGACVVEPFVSQGKAGAARGIDPFYIRTAPDLTVATYFTSTQYAEENPRGRRPLREGDQQVARVRPGASGRGAQGRCSITRRSRRRPLRQIKLPIWRPDLNESTIELLAELSEKYGLIEEQPDLEELIR